jgi:DNA gyrase subunit A
MAKSESGERIHDLDIATELTQSYLRYAMSVIVDRALPDVRDGLKPSQRRILVAMNDLNLAPNRKTLKCAKVVGETMGNYHPHGDQAIYPTLVRMAQEFSMRVPLVDKQGNFGSVYGDPPASMRYTECRMTQAAVEMLEDLDKDTVNVQPNFDGTRTEPLVLPGKFPYLLVNGGSGIAVAMASSIPPHNPGEVARAVMAYLRNPEIGVQELMEHLPGPDFPTGGRICGRAALLEAYGTGRAILEVRARCRIEEGTRGQPEIVVTEIPYQVNFQKLQEKIELVRQDRITGIADLRDESDTELRLRIRLKRGEDPEIVLNQLYKYTPLRDSFSVILIALIEGRPVLCNLRQLIAAYVEHRKVVITRRSRFLLRKAEERDHLVAGLLKALDLIDEVVALIRASADPASAREGLISRFGFSVAQAEAILQMRLQRLTGLQRRELEEEHEALKAQIEDLKAILADERLVTGIIEEDMAELAERHGRPRLTSIEDAQGDIVDLDLVTPENVVVTLTHEGYIKRTGLDAYRRQHRGGKGIIGTESKEGDFVEHLLVANTHDWLLCFTDRGRVYKEQVYALPDMGRYAKGRAIVNFLQIGPGERVQALLTLRDLATEAAIVFATREGVVKRTHLAAFQHIRRGGIIAIQLDDGDSLIGTALVGGDDEEVVLVTARGRAIRFAAGEVRAMGRSTRGVRGISLGRGDRVVGMALVRTDATLLTVCERGYAKRSAFSDYPAKHRGGKGVLNLSPKGLERNGEVVAAREVKDGDEVILITERGQTIRMTVDAAQFRVLGRSTSGVRAIDVPEGDRLVSMAWTRPEVPED